MCKTTFLLILSVIIAGCAAPQAIHYHTLQSAVATSPEHHQPTGTSFLINVLPVSIPAQVDLPQLVIRQSNSGVVLLEQERWVAPLADDIRASLSSYLTQLLNTQDIAKQAFSNVDKALQIKLDVRNFELRPQQYAAMQTTWSLRTSENSRSMVCSTNISVPANGDYSALVQAQQKALYVVAQKIAQTAQIFAKEKTASCPM